MYPECRHVRSSGGTCHSPALAKSHFCYYHARLNQRQSARHANRAPDGRFAALPAPEDIQTIDCGPYPVGAPATSCHPERSEGSNRSLDLPPIEDTESIQLALIEVLQAIAANQLDTKRGGLLLYGLQVASANVRKLHLPIDAVRTISHTEDGTPLAPQDYGLDNEDYEKCDEECEGCEVCGESREEEEYQE
jgi:hypothetical protein